MALNNDASIATNNSVVRDTWVKPEIVSFEPVAAAQAALVGATKDSNSNVS
jgi:hypothetical protein